MAEAKAGEKQTVAQFVVARLREWGVRRIYGYPGDGINGVLGALRETEGAVQFVQVAHEEVAALAATGHAKYTGELGVCLSTAGPGAVHLLNGLYDARLDHQPVLAIVGQQDAAAMGSAFQQEIDPVSLFKDVAGAYVQQVASPDQVRHVVDQAIRTALARRAPTCFILPHDVQGQEAVPEPAHEHGRMHSSVGFAAPRMVPHDGELDAAAQVLNAGKKVAVLVGAGALGAGGVVAEVAERLGAGVAKALLGKAALADDLPFVTGTVGWLGTGASNRMMQECDTLLMVGTGVPYTEFLPEPGKARAVQVDTDPSRIGLRYPVQVPLAGDAGETLRALLPRLKANGDGAWRERIATLKAEWEEQARGMVEAEAPPLNPQLVVARLSPLLPDGCILAGDCGSSTVWYARHLQIREGMMASLSGTLATMGSAVPYALAAKMAHPDRPVVALLGDGAMQMLGNSALVTVARRWREWKDPRLVVVVLNNRDLNYVTWEQRVMEGEPEFTESQALMDFPHAAYAELLGLRGIRVDSPEKLDDALKRAMESDRPVLLEAVVSADMPSLPPRMKPEQKAMLEQALNAGDPDAAGVRDQLERQGYE